MGKQICNSFLKAVIFLGCFLFLSGLAHAEISTLGYRSTAVLTTAQVTCASTATNIFSNNPNRRSWTIVNNSTQAIFLGSDTVTTANGLQLASGQTAAENSIHPYTGALYCIVSSGTSVISTGATSW